ncbi:uncharacterized protein SPSK_00960 [Sporothrix schenckii 1099-18]|uniref:Uncharacterized protein n=1 Tax=Sporothrix schenckii 1099-18 TaxID=1397361 RepID=A0A0F2LZ90_SPOSC|nr:uncharacterized protein SPSK_00960 [Sporothrix schenckii 1099-18]KJR81820.1 hypothetical protein SPSK_00960 [Sporothrix schenckii 1099-18]
MPYLWLSSKKISGLASDDEDGYHDIPAGALDGHVRFYNATTGVGEQLGGGARRFLFFFFFLSDDGTLQPPMRARRFG